MEPTGSLFCSKNQPPVSFLSQMNLVCSLLSQFFNMYLCLGLPSVIFPSCFPTKTPCVFLLVPHKCYTPCKSRFQSVIWWRVQIMMFCVIHVHSLSCYLLPHTLKYLPRHSILEHPQPMFFCDCEWPSFTPFQGNMQSYIYILRYKWECSKFWIESYEAFPRFDLL